MAAEVGVKNFTLDATFDLPQLFPTSATAYKLQQRNHSSRSLDLSYLFLTSLKAVPYHEQ